MTIYTPEFPSTKAMPYVYRGYNPTTGESYIGYHVANVKKNISSSSDLGVVYFTSSKKVKPRFNEFEWTIVAEFFDASDAYDFEQLLIFESWKQPGTLNKRCYHGKLRFWNNSHASDETKLKMSIVRNGKPKSEEHKLKLSIAMKGKLQKPHSDETKLKMSIAKKSRPRKPHSDETKLKMSIARNGKKYHKNK